MRGRTITTAALGLLALSFCPAALASVSSELQSAVQLFAAQNYDGAIMHLALVTTQDPGNAEAHYLLGCCYVRKHVLRDANREYETAARLDPKGQVGIMARAALKSLSPEAMMNAAMSATESSQKAARSQYSSAAPVSGAAPAAAGQNTTASSAKTTGKVEAQRHPPAFDAALAVIKNQADAEKLRHQSLGDQRANAEMATGNGKADELKAEKKATIDYMHNAVATDYHGIRAPKYSDAQIQATSDSYDERINVVLAQAKEQAEKQRQFTAARLSDIDTVVDSLSSQMSSSHGIRIDPKGTNLYIRNYGEGPSTPTGAQSEFKQPVLPEQLAADQDKLILTPTDAPGKMVSRVIPAPLAASQDKLHLKKPGQKPANTQLDVHGRITHM
jgi:hypothetical protein